MLVVGRPDRGACYEAAERAKDRLGLPVQVTIRSRPQREKAAGPFLAELRSRPLLLILDEDNR